MAVPEEMRCRYIRRTGSACRQQRQDGSHWCEYHLRMGVMPLLKVRAEDVARVNPMESLLEDIARSRMWIIYLENQLRESLSLAGVDADIEEEVAARVQGSGLAATSWQFSEGDEGRNFTTRSVDASRPPAVWTMLQAERQHHAQCCRFAIQSGIEAKQLELAERQAEVLIMAMTAFARRLGADPTSVETRHALADALAEARGLPSAVIEGTSYSDTVRIAAG